MEFFTVFLTFCAGSVFFVLWFKVDGKKISKMSQGTSLWNAILGRFPAINGNGVIKPNKQAGFTIDEKNKKIVPNGDYTSEARRGLIR